MKRYIIPLLLMLAGCSPRVKIQTDFEWDYDQWTYKTFDWASKAAVNTTQNLRHKELVDKTIKEAVDAQLALHGYVLSNTQPELILHYQVVVNEEAVLASEAFAYTEDPYWMEGPRPVFTYREGTLIVDLTDAQAGHLVWRGWASAPVDEHYTSEKIQSRINTVVKKMFKNFPGNADRVAGQKEIVTKK